MFKVLIMQFYIGSYFLFSKIQMFSQILIMMVIMIIQLNLIQIFTYLRADLNSQ
jgi:hypothetical protein